MFFIVEVIVFRVRSLNLRRRRTIVLVARIFWNIEAILTAGAFSICLASSKSCPQGGAGDIRAARDELRAPGVAPSGDVPVHPSLPSNSVWDVSVGVAAIVLFEYQAVALARLYSGRNAIPLPPLEEQQKWEREREEKVKIERRKFHEIRWERGETQEWLNGFFQIAGIGRFTGEGRIPPALTKELVWAIEHLKKYPEPGKGREKKETETGDLGADEWVLVEEPVKDLLAFI
ncbi:hypothetical protein LRP88_14153 [Fusarium phalaenopsidis]